MPDTSGPKDGALSAAALKSLKANVHAYESYGRAIVAAALNQAEKAAAAGTQSAISYGSCRVSAVRAAYVLSRKYGVWKRCSRQGPFSSLDRDMFW
jgi:hypothetical protein